VHKWKLYGIDTSPGKQDFAAQFFMADLPQTNRTVFASQRDEFRASFQRFTRYSTGFLNLWREKTTMKLSAFK